MSELRPLGDASQREGRPAPRPKAPEEIRERALEVLEAEFAKALETKHRLMDETDPESAKEKGKALIASLEGANRIALKLGLIDVSESRALFAKAQEDGLYEGWR